MGTLPPEVIYDGPSHFFLTCSDTDPPPCSSTTCDLVFLLNPQPHRVPLARDRQPAACVMFATTGLMFEGQKVRGGGEAEKPPVTRHLTPENKLYSFNSATLDKQMNATHSMSVDEGLYTVRNYTQTYSLTTKHVAHKAFTLPGSERNMW